MHISYYYHSIITGYLKSKVMNDYYIFVDVTQNFDCVFWCGDLNFRLAQPREEVIQWVTDTSFPQQSPVNLHKDQLQTILNEGAVLRGFEEAPITFPPTYKYDPGTQNFDSSSKQRTPAYTDRILFKGKKHTRGYMQRVSHESSNSYKDGVIECLVYDSVPSICTSDHKPVWGVFKTTIRPGIDTYVFKCHLLCAVYNYFSKYYFHSKCLLQYSSWRRFI